MDELKSILLVEDNSKDVELTLAVLAEHNLASEVVVARDGAEALDYLYRSGGFAKRPVGHPVVMLLDLKMPKVDGLEVLRKVKGDDQMKTIPVVVLTSSREDVDVRRAYDLGANSYLVKPVKFHDLAEMVKVLGLYWFILNEKPRCDEA